MGIYIYTWSFHCYLHFRYEKKSGTNSDFQHVLEKTFVCKKRGRDWALSYGTALFGNSELVQVNPGYRLVPEIEFARFCAFLCVFARFLHVFALRIGPKFLEHLQKWVQGTDLDPSE